MSSDPIIAYTAPLSSEELELVYTSAGMLGKRAKILTRTLAEGTSLAVIANEGALILERRRREDGHLTQVQSIVLESEVAPIYAISFDELMRLISILITRLN